MLAVTVMMHKYGLRKLELTEADFLSMANEYPRGAGVMVTPKNGSLYVELMGAESALKLLKEQQAKAERN